MEEGFIGEVGKVLEVHRRSGTTAVTACPGLSDKACVGERSNLRPCNGLVRGGLEITAPHPYPERSSSLLLRLKERQLLLEAADTWQIGVHPPQQWAEGDPAAYPLFRSASSYDPLLLGPIAKMCNTTPSSAHLESTKP